MDELRIPIAHIQYIEVDSQSMVNKIAEECNVNPNEIEWPLIYCNGEPVGVRCFFSSLPSLTFCLEYY